jgi:hypothetical protein
MTTEPSVRFDELRLLKAGWFEGVGSAPPAAGIDWLNDTFARFYPEGLPWPFAYPMPAGGIRLEWPLAPYDVTLDIDLTEHAASLHELNLATNEDREERLNLDEPAEWERLIERIRTKAGGHS